MNLKRDMYLNGFYQGCFASDENLKHLNATIREIRNGNLKNGFSLEKKYASSLDLKPCISRYDDVFLNIILKNDIHKIVSEATGVDLHLAHVQLRFAYPSSKGSYAPWHRDTHLYRGQEIIGNVPPVYKLIYYPSLEDQTSNQLGVISGSHNFLFRSKIFDMSYARLATAKYIKSDNKSFLLFNSAILHKATKVTNKTGASRLIYSFVRKDQLAEYDPYVNDRLNELA